MYLQVDQQDPHNTTIEHSQNFLLKILTKPSSILTLEILYIFLTESTNESDLQPIDPDHVLQFPAPFSVKCVPIRINPAYMIHQGNTNYGFQLITNGSGTYNLEIRPHISFQSKAQKFNIAIFKNDGDLKPFTLLPFTLTRNLIFPPIKADFPSLRYPFLPPLPLPYGQSPLPCSSMAAPFDTPITLSTLHLARAPQFTTIHVLSGQTHHTTSDLTFPSDYHLSLLDTKLTSVDHTNIPMTSRFETPSTKPLADIIPLSSGIPLSQRFTNFHKGGLRIELTNIPIFNHQTINKSKNYERKIRYVSKLAIDFLNSLPPPPEVITISD